MDTTKIPSGADTGTTGPVWGLTSSALRMVTVKPCVVDSTGAACTMAAARVAASKTKRANEGIFVGV